MIERIIIIDNVDPVSFYGVNNCNMQFIRNLFPKLRLAARGSVIKVIGEEAETAEFEAKIKELERHCSKYNKLTDEAILSIVRGDEPKELRGDDVIIYGVNGKPISARSANQQKLVETFAKNDLTFALGPAGTGKTYVAIALAVRALKNREVRKIILSRPAVEAGEKLGFLPGDMKDKIDPYLQPLYDALEDMIPAVKLKEYMETKVIQIAPLAFMRGRTLSDAIIVLDEAQNTTTHQIKMFLTRLGMNAKMIITGDVTQIDLPRSTTSGLVQALRVLRRVDGVGRVEFDRKDIVRHRLVQRIVEAYQQFDEEQRAIAAADAAAVEPQNSEVVESTKYI
jgi:phosphate starvation-inducible PhoH-like protein